MVNLLYKLIILLLLFVFLSTPKKAYADDPLGNWLSTTSLPYLLASHTSFFHINKISLVGGSAVTGQSRFNILTATPSANGSISGWTTTSLTPTALIYHSLVKKENYIYILGGREENPGSALAHVPKVFIGNVNGNGVVNSWTQLNSLPQGTSLGKAVVVGDKIYYAGGFNASGAQEEIYYASINPDGTLGAWTTSSVTLPEPLFGFGMVEHQNNIIVFGGFNGSEFRKKVYKASVNPDGSLSAFSEINALPENVYRGSSIKIGSTLISVSGHNGINFLNKVYFTKINSNGTVEPWQQSTHTLPQGTTGSAIAFGNGFLYITGGFGSTGYQNSVYYAPVSDSDEIKLNVTLLKQTSNPWQSQTYDTANLWNPSNPTINAWGCALTSAAMVFQFHGIKKLPDGTSLDPGTLNRWLNSQHDGYIRNGLLNWLALSRLSRLAKNINSLPFDALEYSRIHGENKPQLTTDISNSIPDILEEPGHFIVGKGINGSTFDINDPFYNRATLNDGYSNTFLSLGRYVPTSTDLSYIMLVVDQSVTIELKDSNGNSIGEQFLQQPLINDANGIGSSGQPLKILYFKKPPAGNYQLLLSSPNNSLYKLEAYLYDQNGEANLINQEGIVGNGNKDTIGINFDKQNSNNSSSQKIITFQSAISDVNELKSLKFIKINALAKEIITLLTSAERDAKRGKKLLTTKKLQTIIPILNGNRGGGLTEVAYQILLYDINYLINHL